MSMKENRFRAWKTLLVGCIHDRMTPDERAKITAEWVLVLYGGKLLDARARNYMSWSDGVAVQKARSIAGACVGVYRDRIADEKQRFL